MQVPVAGLGARKTDGGRSGRSQRGSTLTLGKDEKLLDLLPFFVLELEELDCKRAADWSSAIGQNLMPRLCFIGRQYLVLSYNLHKATEYCVPARA